MLRGVAKIVGLASLVALATVAVLGYQQYAAREAMIRKLEEEKQHLQRVVQRLSDEKRVAQIMVTKQERVAGELRTTLLFHETRNGHDLPPKYFTIKGDMAHIDAMVIKFERELVAREDPLRGHSIVLFTRLFSDQQTPEEAFPIDPPGAIPAAYQDTATTTPAASAFEQELWKNFWRLTEDEAYRKQMGVRVANPESLWGPFKPGWIYTITLEAASGLNRTQEPLKGIYKEALHSTTQAGG